jgi:hypothetical protein
MSGSTIGRSAVLGALLLTASLSACKKNGATDSGKIERYDSEIAASGTAYLAEPVAARSGAEQEATAVSMVPAMKPLARIAERGGFVLVQWSEDSGEKRQGWVPVTSAKPSASAAQLERAQSDPKFDPGSGVTTRAPAPAPRPAAPPTEPAAVTATPAPAGTEATPTEVENPGAPAGRLPAQPAAAPTPAESPDQPPAAPAATPTPAPAPTAAPTE